jgi:Protein of unknown function DUF115
VEKKQKNIKMNEYFLDSKYPLLFLQLLSLNDELIKQDLPSLNKTYSFIYGPLEQKTLMHVKSHLEKNASYKVFWKVTGGNIHDAYEFDSLFQDSSVHLFIDEPLEIMAMRCAEVSSDLDFEHYFFTESHQLYEFAKDLSFMYIIDFYYLNEKKGMPMLAGHILENLKNAESWTHLKEACDIYKGYPLVLIGAGSSLDSHLEFIKNHLKSVPKMAVGSALSICYDQKQAIDFGVVACPNFLSYERNFAKIDCKVLFSQPRNHSLILNSFLGKKVILNQTATFGFNELNQLLGECPVSDALPESAATVATLGLMIALYLGFDPIITCGIDLKYRQKDYAGHIKSDLSDARFFTEITALEQIASKYPHRIFRLGDDVVFKNIDNVSQTEVLDRLKDFKAIKLEEGFCRFKPYTCDFKGYLKKLKDSYLGHDNEQEFAKRELLDFIDETYHQDIFNLF